MCKIVEWNDFSVNNNNNNNKVLKNDYATGLVRAKSVYLSIYIAYMKLILEM